LQQPPVGLLLQATGQLPNSGQQQQAWPSALAVGGQAQACPELLPPVAAGGGGAEDPDDPIPSTPFLRGVSPMDAPLPASTAWRPMRTLDELDPWPEEMRVNTTLTYDELQALPDMPFHRGMSPMYTPLPPSLTSFRGLAPKGFAELEEKPASVWTTTPGTGERPEGSVDDEEDAPADGGAEGMKRTPTTSSVSLEAAPCACRADDNNGEKPQPMDREAVAEDTPSEGSLTDFDMKLHPQIAFCRQTTAPAKLCSAEHLVAELRERGFRLRVKNTFMDFEEHHKETKGMRRVSSADALLRQRTC